MVATGDTVVVPTGDPVFAFAGIARPERFFADLQSAGWRRGRHDARSAIIIAFDARRRRGASPRARRRARRRHCADDREGCRSPDGVRSDDAAGAGGAARRSAWSRRTTGSSDWLLMLRTSAHRQARAPNEGSPRGRDRPCADRAGARAAGRRRPRPRHGAGTDVLHRRPRAPAHRGAESRRGVSHAAREGAPRDRARGVRALRPAARRASEIQHAVGRGDAGARRVRRRGSRALRVRAGQRRPVHHRPLRILGAARDGARAADRTDRPAGARARQHAPQRPARGHPSGHRQHGDLPPGDDPPRDARAAGEAGRRRAHRSARHDARRDLRRLFRASGRDDVSGCRVGAAHRSARGAGVRAAARPGAVPDDLRAPGRAAAPGCGRRRPPVHAALH